MNIKSWLNHFVGEYEFEKGKYTPSFKPSEIPNIAFTSWLIVALIVMQFQIWGSEAGVSPDVFCSLMVGLALLGAATIRIMRQDFLNNILYATEMVATWLSFMIAAWIDLGELSMLCTALIGYLLARVFVALIDTAMKGEFYK